MKSFVCTAFGTVGTFVAAALGGWDTALVSLVTFMIIDYVTGLAVAGIFHKSKKTDSGGLQSRAGFKGLVRKCMVLLLVAVAYRLDQQIGGSYVRDAVCIGFMVNEVISILENASLMGLPIPAALTKALDILAEKQEAHT